MQTFLPYEDFAKSAATLDRMRLGKQRVETLQIMKALVKHEGWVNHPATRMWIGYETALLRYQIAICNEWTRREYKDTCLDKTIALYLESRTCYNDDVDPNWLGNSEFHASHRSNLLRKSRLWYGQFGWSEPDNLDYIWPTSDRRIYLPNKK